MTTNWNPLGLPEVDAMTAERLIKAVKSSKGFDARIEKRGNRPFFVVFETDRGISFGGDLIAKGDVDAVRALLDGGAS